MLLLVVVVVVACAFFVFCFVVLFWERGGVPGGLFPLPSPPQTPPLLSNKRAHSYRLPSVWCGNHSQTYCKCDVRRCESDVEWCKPGSQHSESILRIEPITDVPNKNPGFFIWARRKIQFPIPISRKSVKGVGGGGLFCHGQHFFKGM